MSKSFRLGLYVLTAFFLATCTTVQPAPEETPRNAVFILADGMGFAHVKAYRMYADDPATEIVDPLSIDPLLVGAVSTDTIVMNCDESGSQCERDPYGVTDSASSATAYATGRDTLRGSLSVDPEGAPISTVLEAARTQGKSTGLVATSQVTHASPAAFASHVISRSQYNDIADQFFDSQWQGQPMVDVILGGGLQYFKREDRDLVSEFTQAGYETAFSRSELQNTSGDRLLGLFAPSGMSRALDRDAETPSLEEMMDTALQTLNRNPQGFFLMMEASQVDWAAHGNSVAGVISEMEGFINAVNKVLEFAGTNGDTLVVIVADHETGGMALGKDGFYSWDPRPLRGIKATPAAMTMSYLEGEESLSSIVAANVSFELTDTETSILDATERDEKATFDAIAALFNDRTGTGWSTGSHTSIDVPLYAFGPGSEHFRGVMQNEAIGKVLWKTFLPEQK